MIDCLASKFEQASEMSLAVITRALKAAPKLVRKLGSPKAGGVSLAELVTLLVIAACVFTRYCVLALAAIAGMVWNPHAWIAQCGIQCSAFCAVKPLTE
jgi:hypothetical protein